MTPLFYFYGTIHVPLIPMCAKWIWYISIHVCKHVVFSTVICRNRRCSCWPCCQPCWQGRVHCDSTQSCTLPLQQANCTATNGHYYKGRLIQTPLWKQIRTRYSCYRYMYISLLESLVLVLYLQHGASQEEFLRAEVTQAVKDVAFDLASLANAHLLKVKEE